jgi:hypothetical protein
MTALANRNARALERLARALRTTVRLMPDEGEAAAMAADHTSGIRSGLHTRGESFCTKDCLVFRATGEPNIVIPVEALPVSLGRDPGVVDYQVDASGVSADHLGLVRDGPFIRIKDHHSANGLFLNDRRICAEYLREHDEVRLGTATFTLLRI